MVRKIILLITFILLITACSKEPEVFVPEPVPIPVPIPPKEVEIQPIPEPIPIPDVPIQKPVPEKVIPVNTCTILKKFGTLYTPADVQSGKISFDDYHNLRKCYPYFSHTQADTQAVCCII
ncbi:hypothetical protein KY333_00550 [Candidatus Woesearchaeota archaeon]|nr:hypothetical protein [Candidatus Woesearchaeota archaeon]MBW2994347.1 hypothetical protein [Candidatus Woesearchaeota archaeon]